MSLPSVFIVGAGGFGREVWNWLSTHPDHGVRWKIHGFLDDARNALNAYQYPVGVVDSATTHRPEHSALYVCALGSPKVKERVCTTLRNAGARFLTVVHPSALIGRNVKIGEGSVICPGAIVTADVQLGAFVTLNCRSGIGHDVEVGDFCTLSAFCDVTGHAKLGRGVFMGTHAAVLPNKLVGDYAVIGAGAIVMSKVPAGATLYTPPSKIL